MTSSPRTPGANKKIPLQTSHECANEKLVGQAAKNYERKVMST